MRKRERYSNLVGEGYNPIHLLIVGGIIIYIASKGLKSLFK